MEIRSNYCEEYTPKGDYVWGDAEEITDDKFSPENVKVIEKQIFYSLAMNKFTITKRLIKSFIIKWNIFRKLKFIYLNIMAI